MTQQNWHSTTDYAPEQPQQQQWKIDKRSLPWYLRKRALIPAFGATLLLGLALPGSSTETVAAEGLTEEQVQQIVDDAVAGQQGLSQEDVQGLIDDAIAAEPADAEPEQAETEATENDDSGGNDSSVEQDNAVESAQSYLDFSGFSREGLIGQLEFEGYSTEAATEAVDSLDVDWMEQAVRVAESYMDYSSFSRSGLIDQLMFEGFTQEQAEHGADAVGL